VPINKSRLKTLLSSPQVKVLDAFEAGQVLTVAERANLFRAFTARVRKKGQKKIC